MAKEEQPKKIIVDEDWKHEAQRDKEVLAAKEAQEKQEAPEEEGPRRGGPLPEGNLAALISMLTTQTLFALGFLQLKGEEEREPDLDLARYNIELLDGAGREDQREPDDRRAAVAQEHAQRAAHGVRQCGQSDFCGAIAWNSHAAATVGKGEDYNESRLEPRMWSRCAQWPVPSSIPAGAWDSPTRPIALGVPFCSEIRSRDEHPG